MAFVIDHDYLPAVLNCRPMSDEDFARLCAGHPNLRFEMTAEGELIVMPPTHSITGLGNTKLLTQLENWAVVDGRGFVSDSSTGFVLPNGARRSPDAAWTRADRVRALSEEQREGSWHLCPDFVIEIRSPSDRLRTAVAKMREWIENGAELAWLLDAKARTVTVFRPGAEPEVLTCAEAVQGEDPVAGFVLALPKIWDPLN